MYKIYAKDLDEITLNQFYNAMELECNIQGALMPDAHKGYTIPIGAVIKSKDYLFPSYVGFDIGCGVSAVKLDIYKEDINLERVRDEIVKKIPLGFKKNSRVYPFEVKNATPIAKHIYDTYGKHYMATLGGGNHFIELGEGEDKKVWVIIHSGSRGYGFKIAKYYMTKAMLNHKNIKIENLYEKLDEFEDAEGHYSFHINSEDGQNYIKDMNSAIEFAKTNRKTMTDIIIDLLNNPPQLEYIDKNHNHLVLENGFIIHRKGAISAKKDEIGIIPANMKDGSFIVKGKGCFDSIFSSSHGAGRLLSRKEAKKLDINEFNQLMKNIITNHTDKTIDESPKVYKNIFEVMELQKDLVDVVEHIKPILNIKG